LGVFVDHLTPHFCEAGIVGVALTASLAQTHVMDVCVGRLVTTLYALLQRGVALVAEYNEAHTDFPWSDSAVERFVYKWLLHSLLWAGGGSLSSDGRAALGDLLLSHSTLEPLPAGCRLVDCQVGVDGSWTPWAASVPRIEIEAHKCTATDVVIPTTDTLRHAEVLKAWLAAHSPCILCGPPGSGKTMTLTAVLEANPDLVLAPLNFSSTTTPDLILKTFAQFCEVVDSPEGLLMRPNKATYSESQWLVVFCDEINLPEMDAYGSQRVVMFLRQVGG
jgi:dynein heavy chain 1